MSSNLEVMLWGTRVGYVHCEPYYPYSSFEYDSSFQRSGIELSPLVMKNNNEVYNFPFLSDEPFYNLPGLLSHSLPDHFGRTILKYILSTQGKTYDEKDTAYLLSLIGKNGIGAIEYKPSIVEEEKSEEINISDISFLVRDILKNNNNFSLPSYYPCFKHLFSLCAKVQGNTPKAFVSFNEKTSQFRTGDVYTKGFSPYIIKFDNLTDKAIYNEKTLIEYAYYLMAKKANINVSPSLIFNDNGKYHFLTKRFDRKDGGKLHMQSLCCISHISYNGFTPCSYEKASDMMHSIDLPYKDIEEFYRRMVFNVLSHNENDNMKNTSFLMDKRGKWTLSPFYDATFSKIEEGRKMSICHKTSFINKTDMLLAGQHMGIKNRVCTNIISEVGDAISCFSDIAKEVGIREKTIEKINKAIKENNSIIWF